MARNEEKQYSRLNRIILEKQKEEEKLRNPKRPRLTELNTAEEIKKWLPSIKRDLAFNLKQSEVPCYPDRKIQDFHNEVERLEKEYKAFVRKLRSIDPQCSDVPWTDRPYNHRKRKHNNDDAEEVKHEQAPSNDRTSFSEKERLTLPILQSKFEHQYEHDEGPSNDSTDDDVYEKPKSFKPPATTELSEAPLVFSTLNAAMQDAPLQFKITSSTLDSLGLDYDSSDSDDT